MGVSVITCAIPERLDLLAEAMAAVRAQTYQPAAHLIGIDYARIGTARNLNRTAVPAASEFLAILADDDLLDPHHLERLMAASDGADVVYSWCRTVGRGGWTPNEHFDPVRLRQYNYIPATALIRASAFWEVGGFPDEPLEDYGLWLRLLDWGARFVCVPEITWTYRFLGGNKTFA